MHPTLADPFADVLPFPVDEGDPDVLEIVPSLSEQLVAGGYRPGAPAHVTRETLAVDAAAAAAMPCDACGHAGMTCRPYHLGVSYRVVLSCPRCKSEEEL